MQVKLSSLNLDDHARKKMIKLSDERYCKDTDTLTITTDRWVIWRDILLYFPYFLITLSKWIFMHVFSCPLRQQNYDYAMYLLTVLYHESWVSLKTSTPV